MTETATTPVLYGYSTSGVSSHVDLHVDMRCDARTGVLCLELTWYDYPDPYQIRRAYVWATDVAWAE